MAAIPDYILDDEGPWSIHFNGSMINALVVGFDGACFLLEAEEPGGLEHLIKKSKPDSALNASIPHHTGVYAIELNYRSHDKDGEGLSTISVELVEEVGHINRRGALRASAMLDAKVHEKSTTQDVQALVHDVSETGVGLWFTDDQDFASVGSEFVLDAEDATLGWFTATLKVMRVLPGSMKDLFTDDALEQLPGGFNPNLQGSYVGAELINPTEAQIQRLRQFIWHHVR